MQDVKYHCPKLLEYLKEILKSAYQNSKRKVFRADGFKAKWIWIVNNVLEIGKQIM